MLEFYPTPKELLERMNFKFYTIKTVLEPSAGKGDIADYVRGKCDADIDCIEIDPNLRHILTGKGYPVVHDDFLTYEGRKQYDLIIMNPPFSNGDEHLLKALELMERGGNIVCILNAETIRNPFSNKRKVLVQKLSEYNADIEYVKDAFKDAERKTDVEVALIKVAIPQQQNSSSVILEQLRHSGRYEHAAQDVTAVASNDYIEAIVDQFNLEVDACFALMDEYESMLPYIMNKIGGKYAKPVVSLVVHGQNTYGMGDYKKRDRNLVLKRLRQKYWNALFSDKRFVEGMTSNQLAEYTSSVDELKDYDFSYYNIKTLQVKMMETYVKGIEQCIIELFDKLSYAHTYIPESKHNIHYYNGATRLLLKR